MGDMIGYPPKGDMIPLDSRHMRMTLRMSKEATQVLHPNPNPSLILIPLWALWGNGLVQEGYVKLSPRVFQHG